jgi:hypothetical protein
LEREWGEGAAYVWLGLLLFMLVAFGIAASWHGVWNVDNRTYLEMIDGVRQHGLPFILNGDAERFRAARAPFELPAHGKLWGEYPPLFPYVAAPALALGGVPAVYRLNVLLVAAIGLVTFELARRVWGSARLGAAAAYVVVLSSPTWAGSAETFAQPLLTLLLMSATLTAVAILDAPEPRRRVLSVAVGVLAGLAVNAHLLGLPPMLVLCLGLAFVPAPFGVPSIRRAGLAVGALAVMLIPLAILNGYRFGTLNPVTYGPCIWANCLMTGTIELKASSMLTWAAPGVAWAGATALALVFVRTSPRAMLLVGAVSLAALLPPWIVRERVVAMGRVLWSYVVDVSQLNLRLPNSYFAWFGAAPDGLGDMHVGADGTLAHGTAVKGMLESSPILALSALAEYGRTGVRGRALVCSLPAIGIAAELTLNARFPGASAISFPYLFPRYVVPAVPMLAVLAVGAVRDLPWKKLDLVPSVLVAVVGLAFFLPQVDDRHWVRRFVELRVTLAVVAIALLAAYAARRWPSRWSRVACFAVSVAFGAGMAVSLGVDTRILTNDLAASDRRVLRFA